MGFEEKIAELAQQMGETSAKMTLVNAEDYVSHEKCRIELANRSSLVSLEAEFSYLVRDEEELEERLRRAPRLGDFRNRRRKEVYNWLVAALLSLSCFFFSLYTFEPFRVGWKGPLYCLGAAIGFAFVLGLALEKWDKEFLLKTIASIACLSGIVGLAFLAVIRGDLLAQQLMNATPAIVFGDAEPVPQPHTDFYAATVVLLRATMILLAIAMDLGAGLALHEAWRLRSVSSDDPEALRKDLSLLRDRKIEIAREVTELQNQPDKFVHAFWANFYRALLTHTMRDAMSKLSMLLMLVLLVGKGARAQTHLDLVIAADLSKSVASHGPGQASEFEQNIQGISRLLTQVPAGSRVTIIGITDQSFAHPLMLLSASLADDPGYFGERLALGRAALLRKWREYSQGLRPIYPQTDIVGGLMVASQVFADQSKTSHKVLVIFSDMKNDTEDLTLDSLLRTPRAAAGNAPVIVDLKGVEVQVFGADAGHLSTAQWIWLQNYWSAYLKHAGATLRTYSALRQSGLPIR